MALSALLALGWCVAFAAGAASKAYFVENSNTVPGDVNLWSFDFTTKNATQLATFDKNGDRDFLSSAKVCNGTFVAVWDVFPTQVGIASYDLVAGGAAVFVQTDWLLHDIACAGGTKVLAVASLKQKKGVDFWLVSIDYSTGEGTQIGKIPHPKSEAFEGWDSIFRFSEDTTKLYAAFGKASPLHPSSLPSASNLFVLDTASGSVTDTYVVEGTLSTSGCLYTAFEGLTRGITIKIPDQGGATLTWVDLKCSGSKCKVHSTGTDADGWTFGKPLATCGDDVYALEVVDLNKETTQPFLHSSIKSGKTDTVIDLSTLFHSNAGALAVECA